MKIVSFEFIKKLIYEINPSQNFYSLNKNVKADILAGIIVAIIALPLALAFGEVSNMGPRAGVISAAVGGIVGGLFGGCFVGVSGPTMPMASQVAAFGAVLAASGSNDINGVFSIIFLSGVVLICFSFLRISKLIHFVPYPAIAGFMCGIAALVVIGQINPLLGVNVENNNDPVGVLLNLLNSVKNTNFIVLAISLPSIILLFFWDKISLKINFLKDIPSPLPVLVIGSFMAYILGMRALDETLFISSIQNDNFSIYYPDLSRFSQYIGPAIGLACLALIDSLLSCRVADTMTGTRHKSNREAFGQGIANVISGIFGGISTATATTQTVGNITFGAKTPLATITKGIAMLLVLLFLGKFMSYIPISCLAAILIKLGIDIVDYRILPVLKNISLSDLFVFVTVLFVTVFADIIIAVGMGVLISLIRYYKQVYLSIWMDNAYSYSLLKESKFSIDYLKNKNSDSDSTFIMELNGALFFGTIEILIKSYTSIPKHNVLVLDMSKVSLIDLSGVFALEDLIKKANKNKSKIYISNVNDVVKEYLEKLSFEENIGFKVIVD